MERGASLFSVTWSPFCQLAFGVNNELWRIHCSDLREPAHRVRALLSLAERRCRHKRGLHPGTQRRVKNCGQTADRLAVQKRLGEKDGERERQWEREREREKCVRESRRGVCVCVWEREREREREREKTSHSSSRLQTAVLAVEGRRTANRIRLRPIVSPPPHLACVRAGVTESSAGHTPGAQGSEAVREGGRRGAVFWTQRRGKRPWTSSG